jgi:2-dehydropantoate 2-reductase
VIWAQNGIPWWYFQSDPGRLAGRVLESVDPGGVIARSIPSDAVVGCVVYCSTEIVTPGVIRHVEGTRFAIGEPDGALSERCLAISQSFAQAGLKAPVEREIRNQIWLKVIGNVAFNPITALARATLAQLGTLPEMLQLLRAMFAELAAVAEALNVTLPVTLERRLAAGIAVGDHKTSMLQDLEAGKRLEVDCLTGAVVEIADMVGVPTPHTRSIHACAKLLDALARARADSRLEVTSQLETG